MSIQVYRNPHCQSTIDSAENFLIDIFRHGNYCFRKALSGWDGSGLETLLGICRVKGILTGLALALYDIKDPRIAIFGPIAVNKAFRNKGIGNELSVKVLDSLKENFVKAVYLGVKESHPARTLYRKLGFRDYSGVVMRKMLVNDNQFEHDYYRKDEHTNVRSISWADYPKFMALFSYPCKMKSFDINTGYLSSRYMPITRFLGVFPEIIANCRKGDVNIQILTSGKKQAIVGIAKTQKLKCSGLKGINLDFFIHDNFTDCSKILIESIIQSNLLSDRTIFSRSIISDDTKRQILEKCCFNLNFESEQKISGDEKEIVQTYKYMGELK